MHEVRVDHTDDGRTIRLHVGDVLVVTLPVNMLTGLHWEVASYDQSSLDRPEVVVKPPDPGQAMGAGGTLAVFRFPVKATTAAPAQLVLELRGGTGPAEQVYRITLDIRE
ncbi:protease inhibitor I42 family protein [Streptomyces smaragdinus]|uniref:protease inhibitor I42 family protein n=1 Tax=Streptomyces smaragdinus TaxID=2585196 RepID=UPI001886A47C|nr:protease inhibitor I42 family protein [Streptomyces smaragdinus]